METEQQLVEILYGKNPVESLAQQVAGAFRVTDPKQFALFYLRLVKRMEERLSLQFGASLALLEERVGLGHEKVAQDFIASPEYRLVREDVTDAIQSSESRLEIGFLNFVLRTQNHQLGFLDEFCEIYLRELAMGSG